MIKEAVLRGYLLEEALAWLLRGSAYEVIVAPDQGPDPEVIADGSRLSVRGRGTTHQVDVLGEFAYTPAFSLPVRLFLEAKFYTRGRCPLGVVRNALGVIQDVNQNYVTDLQSYRPRRRFQYCYALFSTSGFSEDAQDFALAHQISFIDLSGESYEGLRTAIHLAAHELWGEASARRVLNFPVNDMRKTLRAILGTAELGTAYLGDELEIVTDAPTLGPGTEAILGRLADDLHMHIGVEMLLGFPAAPFVVPLATDDKPRFIRFANSYPSHPVRLRRTGQGAHAEWIVNPYNDPEGYELRFALPQRLEGWVNENDEQQRLRTSTIKQQFLPNIMVYYLDSGIRACQLKYEPGQLRRA